MTTTNKAKNTVQEAKGKVKETAGRVTGNDELEAKGKTDQKQGDVKQAAEKIKDAIGFKK